MIPEETKKKVHQVVVIANIVAETIEECGPLREGPLFAMLMTLIPGLTLESFTQLVDLLVRAGRVTRGSGHLLTAVPKS